MTKIMALAIRFDQLIRDGEVAELARVGHVSRARFTQIMNLLCLAPDIQEELLFLPTIERGRDAITERGELRGEELRGENYAGELRGDTARWRPESSVCHLSYGVPNLVPNSAVSPRLPPRSHASNRPAATRRDVGDKEPGPRSIER